MKIYKERNGTVVLKGQHSCILEMPEGINEIVIKVMAGKLRLNHGCFTPDGGTWLSARREGEKHTMIYQSRRISYHSRYSKVFGRLDRIDIVNLSFFQQAVFDYEIAQKMG